MEIKGHRPNQFFRDLLPKPKDARPSAGSVAHALPGASGSGYGAPLMSGQHPATDRYINFGFVKYRMERRSANTPPVIAHWAPQNAHPPVAFGMPQTQAYPVGTNANPAFPWMPWDANNVGTPLDQSPPYSPSRQTSAPMANVNLPLPPTSWLPQPGASFYPPMSNAHPASPWGPWDTQQHMFGNTTSLGPDSHLLRSWNPPASPGNIPAPYPSIQQEYGHNHGNRESAPPLPPPHLDLSFQSRSSTLTQLIMRIPAESVSTSPVSNAADTVEASTNQHLSRDGWTVQSSTTTTSSQWRISRQAPINSNAADPTHSIPTRLGEESEVVNTESEEVRYRTADDVGGEEVLYEETEEVRYWSLNDDEEDESDLLDILAQQRSRVRESALGTLTGGAAEITHESTVPRDPNYDRRQQAMEIGSECIDLLTDEAGESERIKLLKLSDKRIADTMAAIVFASPLDPFLEFFKKDTEEIVVQNETLKKLFELESCTPERKESIRALTLASMKRLDGQGVDGQGFGTHQMLPPENDWRWTDGTKCLLNAVRHGICKLALSDEEKAIALSLRPL